MVACTNHRLTQQLNIVGGGSTAPKASELVKFPGGYSDSDSGLALDVYANSAQTQTCYTIPGPPLYSGAKATVVSLPACGGTSASGTATGTSTKTTTGAGTAPTCTSAQYAQCGGSGAYSCRFKVRSVLNVTPGFTGCTTCASGSTCKVSSTCKCLEFPMRALC